MEVSLVDTNPVLRKSETDFFQDISLCTLIFESGMSQTPRTWKVRECEEEEGKEEEAEEEKKGLSK
ncbi:hypothetical protein CR513_57421, partial [Mucuna pruriens]